MSDSSIYASEEGVAIIGMSGRFPGAKNIEEFWDNLRDGVESITSFTDEELIAAGVKQDLLSNPNYVKAGTLLDGVEMFDAPFFGFNPRDAEIMDPQQRLFLEHAWEAIESAGYNCETYEGLIGVYAGVSMNSYFYNNLADNTDLEGMSSLQIIIGNDKDHLPTRVSYKLNLKGPSVNVQTACSTSLVATHFACQGLLSYQCDIALAGGSSVKVPQQEGYLYQDGSIVSPDGHCRAFDARAGGTVGGSGVGVVVLKRLADAIADGDYIHAVIKGTAINNDGSAKVGYTAPSVQGQAEVIVAAQAAAGVDPETITCIEAHGTGTELGDPIEINALTQAFRAGTKKNGYCAIGSVKTNIGHLDAAAGVASLVKTVLALKHKMLPPSLHFEQANPKIDFENSPFRVNNQLTPWHARQTPRRAGVSSFGIGGTNAHVILEEAPRVKPSGESRSVQLLLLSARTPSALDAATANLVQHLKHHPSQNLADVAYTLQAGRKPFKERRMLVCHNPDDAIQALEILDQKRVLTNSQEGAERHVVFMFPGQGAQYVNMGLELYRSEQTYREQVDLCAELLKPHLGLDLREVLYPRQEQVAEAELRLMQTNITQPAVFVVAYATAKLWMEWGVQPEAMIGHSIGEYVAACLAGVFTLEDALRLVAARGKLVQQMPAGAMLAVSLSPQRILDYLHEELSLAASNGPNLCVVSGPLTALGELEQRLALEGVKCQRLLTSHAFHSGMMDPVLSAFTEEVKKVQLRSPQIRYLSNVTGRWITSEEATEPLYWARHLRQTVRFAEGVAELRKESRRILLEVGPGRTLSTLAKQHQANGAQGEANGEQSLVLSSLRHPLEEQSDVAFMLNTLGQLWLAGKEIDWSNFYARERRHRLPLPTYPFERQRYWIEPQRNSNARSEGQTPLSKRADISDWFYVPSWKRSAAPALIKENELQGEASNWLVFLDETGLGQLLVQQLEDEGQQVSTVTRGEQFARLDARSFSLNPGQPKDYAGLLRELRATGDTPQTIFHLWGVTEMFGDAPDEVGFAEQCQDVGFHSLMFLVQALGEQSILNPVRLEVVTNNMQEVVGGELLFPAKATVLGPCRVIPQEYPNISCRSLDVLLPETTEQRAKLVQQLIAEATADDGERTIAYRQHHRWVQRVEAVRLPEPVVKSESLRERGVYLITGGMEKTGLELASYLAQEVRARLVLVGRETFPGENQREGVQAASTEGSEEDWKLKHVAAMEAVEALESLGAEVLTIRADVTDRAQMREVIARARERFGEIHGVIHAEEVLGAGIIQLKSLEMSASVLGPKLKGTLILAQALADLPLDFFILYSSAISLMGGFGQVDYCAANSFLDAFAQHKLSAGGPRTLVLNWGLRQWDEWPESSFAVARELQSQIKDTQEQFGITLPESVLVFRRILSTALSQVIVSPLDLQALMDQQRALSAASLPNGQGSARQPGATHRRPQPDETYVPPSTEAERIIADIWQDLLGIESVGVDDNFLDLGGHSLLATQVISQIREAFEIELPINKLFEEPTVAGLARIVTETQLEGLETEGVADLLAEIEGLSLDEIKDQLAAEVQVSSGGSING
jgi:acyl transferase domain-containing protein/acyl carrier protein